MGIAFNPERWALVRETSRRWWAGALDRPLIRVVMDGGHDPGRPAPALSGCSFAVFHDLSIPAAAIVDRWDYDLSCRLFLGDAFPTVQPLLGTDIVAAFLGALPEIGSGTVWLRN